MIKTSSLSKLYVCIMDFLLQPDPYAVAERKPGQRCISDDAGPTLPYPGQVTRALAVSEGCM